MRDRREERTQTTYSLCNLPTDPSDTSNNTFDGKTVVFTSVSGSEVSREYVSIRHLVETVVIRGIDMCASR